jgi:hypothetical protein
MEEGNSSVFCAFIYAFKAVLGIYALSGWQKVISGFKIKLECSYQACNYDIHKVAGIILHISRCDRLLQVFAGTFTNKQNQQFTPQRLPPNLPEVKSTLVNGKPTLKLDEILRSSDVALPGATSTFINLPEKP